MRRSSVLRSLPLALLLGLLLPADVAAFRLSGCSLTVTSTAANGTVLGRTAGGDGEGTQDRPLDVDYEGTLSYSGSLPFEAKANTYATFVNMIPTPVAGGSPNEDDNRTGANTLSVAANSPFRITGIYFVSGRLEASGGRCDGMMVVRLLGDPVGTVPWVAGLGALILGLGLLVGALRGSLLAGLLGGPLAGIGAAVLLTVYSLAPLGEPTMVVVIVAGAGLGVVIGLVGRSLAAGKPTDTNPDVGMTG